MSATQAAVSAAKAASPVPPSTVKLYTQKGQRLVWLTKKQLPATVRPGDRYDSKIEEGVLTIKFSETGRNKVYKKKTKDGEDPVLAIKGKQQSDAFGVKEDGIIEHVPVKTNGKTMVIARQPIDSAPPLGALHGPHFFYSKGNRL